MKKKTQIKNPKNQISSLEESFSSSVSSNSSSALNLIGRKMSSVRQSMLRTSLKNQVHARLASSVSSLNSSNMASSLTPINSSANNFTSDNSSTRIKVLTRTRGSSSNNNDGEATNNNMISIKEKPFFLKKSTTLHQRKTSENETMSNKLDIDKGNSLYFNLAPSVHQTFKTEENQDFSQPYQIKQKRRQTLTMEILKQEEEKEKLNAVRKRRFSLGRTMGQLLQHSRKHIENHEEVANEGEKLTSNSSYIEKNDGIPLRLHGKIKYAGDIMKVKKKRKYIVILRAILALLVVILIQFENEALVTSNYDYNPTVTLMKSIITVFTVLEVGLIFFYYYLKILLFKYRTDKLRQHVTYVLCRSKYIYGFGLDLLLHLFVNPPGFNYTFRVTQQGIELVYSWDQICACISLLRLHVFIDLIPQFSQYTQNQAKRLCNQNGTKANTQFSWKAMMKQYPYILLGITILLSVLVFGIIIRNLERSNQMRNGKLDYAWDSFWLVIIVMLTIGYGDITIDTNTSRMIFIFCIVWGFLIYALFVVSMNVLTAFDINEKAAYKEFKKQEGIKTLKKSAGKTIANFILFNHYLKKKQRLIDHTKTQSYFEYTKVKKQQTLKQIKDLNSSKYMFNMLFMMNMYHRQRMVHMAKDEDIEKLLQNMEFHLYMSQNEQSFFLEKFEDAEALVLSVMKNNQRRKETVSKAKQLSYQILNLSKIISEFGAQAEVKSIDQIDGKQIMTMEEMNNFNIQQIENKNIMRSIENTELSNDNQENNSNTESSISVSEQASEQATEQATEQKSDIEHNRISQVLKDTYNTYKIKSNMKIYEQSSESSSSVDGNNAQIDEDSQEEIQSSDEQQNSISISNNSRSVSEVSSELTGNPSNTESDHQ